ncbi:hypothetical protein UCRPC4_g05046 [Phaeomoniella chlamydospora]|uniref:F-box domain protein n=1 Tax=Phaeomoniella chlamydospora TaxID=158046 RepID=A0A0G2E6T4_PHACM|nr:hypothetical protein UCRPC4_g05046 [Phaeomoniella chlamydospora]
MTATLQRVTRGEDITSVSPYTQQVKYIAHALGTIGRHIKRLALLKPFHESKTATCDVHGYILKWARQNYAGLESLRLDIEKCPLTFLSHFKSLRCFHFSGFSVTPPEETLRILNSLPQLQHLKITGPPQDHEFHQRSGYRGQPIVQSITPMVLANLHPLRRISICELHDPFRDDAVLLSSAMLQSLTSTHSPTLESLSLTSNTTLSDPITYQINLLLTSSPSISTLDLAFPSLPASLLHSIPPSTQTLRILSTTPDDSSIPGLSSPEIISILEQRSSELCKLRELCLWRYTVPYEIDHFHGENIIEQITLPKTKKDPFEVEIKELRQRTENLKWILRWEFWNPTGL